MVLVFVGLLPWADNIFATISEPLREVLPGGQMIATQVASPLLTPFKLTFFVALFVAMPVVLYQIWAFVAPGLYKKERRFAMPLLASSIALFYLGIAFAYYVVFPLMFNFFTSIAPEGVEVQTDISQFLDFITTIFFAFGLAFEVPVVTVLLVKMGMATPESLSTKRPYIIVGAFVVGMVMTPPDIFSQTMLAIPVWLLFEAGLYFSKLVRPRETEEEEPSDDLTDQQV